MRNSWVLVLLLGMGAVAAAQESRRFNLLDGEGLPLNLAAEEQGDPSRQAKQDPTEPSKKMESRADQEVFVVAGAPKEEYGIGPTRQSEWTTHRRFSATRVYIQQPPGGVEFEHWIEIREPKKGGKPTEVRMREEFEFGLGGRWQLDLYMLTEYEDSREDINNQFGWRGWSAEVRYALADWNVIPGNPTLYFEYIFRNNSGDFIEPKLLLGGELAPGWHWGINFVYEREIARKSEQTIEAKITGGLSYTLIDQKLGIGPAFEAAYEAETEAGVTGRSREFHFGPSIQFRPIPRAHLNLEPLWGCTGESKRVKIFLIFGWDF